MDLKKIELKLLECLVALVEDMSVTRAAARLDLSQPRMSNALARLRAIFDDPLLVRSGHQMVATERALEIANQIRVGLDEIGAALSNSRCFDPRTSKRSFTVMLSDYTAALLMPRLLSELQVEAPNIQILSHPMTHDRVQSYLEDGTCDLAIGLFGTLGPNLRITKCFQDRPALIVREGHPDIVGDVGFDEFLTARHVILAATPASISKLDVNCDRKLQSLGVRRNISARLASSDSAARVVAATDLVCLLPGRLADDLARHLPLQCLEPPMDMPPFDVVMIWHERSHRDTGHAWLRDHWRKAGSRL